MMRAGRYYVGDLGFVWVGNSDAVAKLIDGEHNLDGIPFVSYHTKRCCGPFKDQQGREYSVDLGAIGCIDAGYLLPKEIDEVTILGLGQFIEFTEDFSTGSEDGVLTFGHILIDTNPLEDEEEDV